ncbi:hypothetical protein PINS_up018179 [Pythium insidiosum]|nr:hypothetical protein PINS_up017457 [Pythium insidiosum]GLE07578.1 hypothetical protein PINS_up018179 [Pythium insidiosum]
MRMRLNQLAVLIFTIVAVILVAAGVMQVLDEDYYKSQGQHLQFHEAVYFVFVTISTIGTRHSEREAPTE